MTSSLARWRRGRRRPARCGYRLLGWMELVRFRVVEDGRVCLRVDGSDHAGLAMPSLTAVEPDGLGVLDADGVGQDLGCRGE